MGRLCVRVLTHISTVCRCLMRNKTREEKKNMIKIGRLFYRKQLKYVLCMHYAHTHTHTRINHFAASTTYIAHLRLKTNRKTDKLYTYSLQCRVRRENRNKTREKANRNGKYIFVILLCVVARYEMMRRKSNLQRL